MIRGKLINAAASLNNYQHIKAVEYMIGDSGLTMNFQLFDPQLNLRFIPPSTAVVKVTFNQADGTTFQKTGTFIDSGDRSLIATSLLTADLTQLLDGNLNFTVDLLGDQTQIVNGVIFSALQQIIKSVALM